MEGSWRKEERRERVLLFRVLSHEVLCRALCRIQLEHVVGESEIAHSISSEKTSRKQCHHFSKLLSPTNTKQQITNRLMQANRVIHLQPVTRILNHAVGDAFRTILRQKGNALDNLLRPLLSTLGADNADVAALRGARKHGPVILLAVHSEESPNQIRRVDELVFVPVVSSTVNTVRAVTTERLCSASLRWRD